MISQLILELKMAIKRTYTFEGNDSLDLSTSGNIIGAVGGFQKVTIRKGVTNVQADENVERFNFPEKISSYQFSGSKVDGLQIKNTNGVPVLTISPLLKQKVTLAFLDGSAELGQTDDKFVFGDTIITDKTNAIQSKILNKTDTSTSKPSFSIVKKINSTVTTTTEGYDAEFEVKLSEPLSKQTKVGYSIVGNNKDTILDFNNPNTDIGEVKGVALTKGKLSGDLTFEAGETTKIITIPVKFDGNDEKDDEGVTLALKTTSLGVSVDKGKSVVTTTFSNPVPPTFMLTSVDAQKNTPTQEGKIITFTITPSSIVNVDTPLNFKLTGNGDNPTLDADFEKFLGEIIFHAGDKSSRTLEVKVLDDNRDEGVETYKAQLLNSTNEIAAIDGQIKDTIPTVKLGVTPLIVNEGEEITLMAISDVLAPKDLVIPYTLTGVGIKSDDFTNGTLNGNISILSGKTTGELKLELASDGITEGDETITTKLTATDSFNVDATTYNAVIKDTSQTSTSNVTLKSLSSIVNEGSTATYEVGRANAGSELMIPYVLGGTATAGSDYMGNTKGVFIIPAGSKTATVSFPILADNTSESDEPLIMTLDSPYSGKVTTTIKDTSIDSIILDDTNRNFDANKYNFSNKGSVTVTGTVGPDKINLGRHLNGEQFVISQAKGGSGSYSLGDIKGSAMPTEKFDVIYGVSSGDSINFSSYAQTKNLALNTISFTLPSGSDNKVMRGEGWYNSNTNEFTLLSSGIDTLLIYDSNPVAGTTQNERSYEAIVLIGVSIKNEIKLTATGDGILFS
jgi:hypothetical protein